MTQSGVSDFYFWISISRWNVIFKKKNYQILKHNLSFEKFYSSW